jgi:negative regulator of flagellin synthesis FlgM
MEISGHGGANELTRLLLGAQATDRAGDARPVDQAPGNDQVALSDRAKELKRIKALVDAPGVAQAARAARVEGIKAAIEAGTYRVESRAVADALIRDRLTEALL